ncbi:hypothetical protein FGG08_006453 [Glutinoglossum americanum]|uniref:Uncharacterized protein n=1 Tax=Glutinoglossum americanum TaxID=1670608 RepID=A0A9P8HSK7_9PEZI|nr:hypothetical protein FGG08_006453 [Glutinoglossum americanum]
MLRNTLMHDQLSLLDALVLLELCFGYLFSVLSLFGYRTRLFGKVYISIIGTYIRLFLAAAICGYSVWFWFEGAEHLNQGDCGAPVMFFFAKVHVLGWIRFLWRVVACFCALYFCTVFLAGFIAFLVWVGALAYTAFTSTAGFREEWRHFWDVARAGDEKAAEVADKTKARRAYNLLSIVNLLFIPWSIVSIELTINWNHLTGVTGSAGMKGSGQLIPALIGIGGFLRIIWIMITNSMDAKKKISDAVNPTPDTTGDNKLESQDTLSPISPSLNRAKTIAFKLNGQLLVDILSLSFLMRLFEKKTGLKEARGDRSAQDNSEDAAGAAGAVKPTDGVTSPVVEVSEKPSGGNNSPS